MLRAVANLIAILASLALSACSTAPNGAQDPYAAAPLDFTLDVTILERPLDRVGDELAPAREAHQRPSRYILFADGSLCYGPDPDGKLGVNWVPPTARILNRRQVADVWSLAQQLGFTNPQSADPTINFKTLTPSRGERLYLIEFYGSEERWNFIRRVPIDQPNALEPAAVEFIQHLAKLAWADDPDVPIKYLPKRYDFGPDPYTRYRTP